MPVKFFAISSAAVFLVCSSVFAAPEIVNVKWQKSYKQDGKVKFEDLNKIIISSDGKNKENLRLLITLKNLENKPIEGIVIRAAFSMRLAKPGTDSGAWAVPFYIDERRVAKINAGQQFNAAIPNMDLNNYLNRLKNSDYWINALKAEIMIEPRKGDDILKNTAQSILPVNAK